MPFTILLQQGGPIMPIILIAALVGYILATERLIVWGRWYILDRNFLGCGNSWELAEKLGGNPPVKTPLSRLLQFALGCREAPLEEREKAMELAIMKHLPSIETRLATIGWLGGILPMLGLLGTVSGMIATFNDLSFSASRQILSQGLSEALWTTEVGLLGAIPLLAAHHLLTRLKSRWLNQLELNIALLFSDSGRKENHEA